MTAALDMKQRTDSVNDKITYAAEVSCFSFVNLHCSYVFQGAIDLAGAPCGGAISEMLSLQFV